MASKLDAIRSIQESSIPISQVIDVGVNYQTEDLIAALPSIEHILFEIDSGYKSHININYANIKHKLYNIGLSDHNKSAYVISYSINNDGIATHSKISTEAPIVDNQAITNCKVVDIRRFDALNINTLNDYLLKIDIDGEDLAALKGFGKKINSCSVIIIEATYNKIQQVIYEIANLGFGLVNIVDIVYYGNSLYQCDLVFVRSNLINQSIRPSITDFQKELWKPEQSTPDKDSQAVIAPAKMTQAMPTQAPLQIHSSKSELSADLELGLITNNDWSLLVPLNEFYKDKVEHTFTLSRFNAEYKNATHGSISKSHTHSKIWTGHDNYKDLRKSIEKFKPSIALDIGGFAGIFAIALASFCKEVEIYIFEPIPTNLLVSALNLSLNSARGILLPFAVGEDMRMVGMTCNPKMSISAKVQNSKLSSDIIAPQVSIDSMLMNIKNERACIKIDVEGLEPTVLKGMNDFIAHNKVGIIILEYHPESWRDSTSRAHLQQILSCFLLKKYCTAWQFSNSMTEFSDLDNLDQRLAEKKIKYCDVILSNS